MPFPGSLNVSVDSDTYNFAVESNDPATNAATLRAEFEATVTPDQRNLIVLAELNELMVPIVIPDVPLDLASSGFDVTIVNAAQSAPSFDVYLTPLGTDVSTVSPTNTLSFGGFAINRGVPAGSLVLTLTAPGDPSTVLYTSNATTFAAGPPVIVVIVPDANGIDGILSAHLVASSSLTLVDVNAPAGVRFVNGAADQLPRDFYLNGDFTTPFAAAVPFGTPTDFLLAPLASSQISVTPAGNPSVVEVESDAALNAGRRYDMLIAGPGGGLGFQLAIDNRIRISTSATILIMNSVSYYPTLNVYLVPPGTDITAVLPTWTVSTPVVTTRASFAPEQLELTITDTSSNTVVYGPSTVTLEADGIYSIAITDSGDGTTVTPLFLDDFQ